MTLHFAPRGFNKDQWARFNRDGFLVLDSAISTENIARYRQAHRRIRQGKQGFDPGRFSEVKNMVAADRTVAELIDHPDHIGYVYDLFGELTKLHMSQCFWRPRMSKCTEWHIDGPRAVPMSVYSGTLPMLLKVGYWLTPVDSENMGNLVVVPGSHRRRDFEQYTTHDRAPGEIQLKLPAGSITLMHAAIWHRTAPVTSGQPRENFYLSYCPSWIESGDRKSSDSDWLNTLTREQRIIMRDYKEPYRSAKPPASDSPLYLADPGTSTIDDDNDNVPPELRRRRLRISNLYR